MCGRNNIIPHIFYGPFVFYSEKLCTLSSSGISTRRCFELKKYSRVEHFDCDEHETNVDRWKKTTTKSTSRRNSSINIKYSEFLLICLHSPPSMLQHEFCCSWCLSVLEIFSSPARNISRTAIRYNCIFFNMKPTEWSSFAPFRVEDEKGKRDR